jgi:hypothetical protein
VCTCLAKHSTRMLVEVKISVHALRARGVGRHGLSYGLELRLLLLRGSERMTPFATVADGMEVDTDGEREDLGAGHTAVEILSEPADHSVIVEDLASAPEVRRY